MKSPAGKDSSVQKKDRYFCHCQRRDVENNTGLDGLSSIQGQLNCRWIQTLPDESPSQMELARSQQSDVVPDHGRRLKNISAPASSIGG